MGAEQSVGAHPSASNAVVDASIVLNQQPMPEIKNNAPVPAGNPSALVIVGPSGVGKGTLISKLMSENNMFGFSTSHTTRQPRPGEVHGQHYYFTTKEQFCQEIAEGKFLEYAEVHGRIYGTSKQAVRDVLDSGRVCVLDIDVQGARSLRKSDIRAIYVFIAPPSLEDLAKRLAGRGTEGVEQISLRLSNAKSEINSLNEQGLYDYLIINDDINEALAKLGEIASRAASGLDPEPGQVPTSVVIEDAPLPDIAQYIKDAAAPAPAEPASQPSSSTDPSTSAPSQPAEEEVMKQQGLVASGDTSTTKQQGLVASGDTSATKQQGLVASGDTSATNLTSSSATPPPQLLPSTSDMTHVTTSSVPPLLAPHSNGNSHSSLLEPSHNVNPTTTNNPQHPTIQQESIPYSLVNQVQEAPYVSLPAVADASAATESSATGSDQLQRLVQASGIVPSVATLTLNVDAGVERWSGRVALITGASSGIGSEVCQVLAGAGIRVVAVARRKERLEDLQRTICVDMGIPSSHFLPVVCDVTKEAEVATLPKIVAKRWPGTGIDILVNNAGMSRNDASLFEGSVGSWVEMLSTNVLGTCMCTKVVLQDMIRRDSYGHIINMVGLSGHRLPDGPQGGGFYCGTKAAVKMITEGLRQEARGRGVPLRVSAISPGIVETEFFSVRAFGDADAVRKATSQFKCLDPGDVARAMLWCLSAPDHVEVNDIVIRPSQQMI